MDYTGLFNELLENAPVVRASDWRQRVEKLKKLHKEILMHQAEIREALWTDFRKPGAEVDFSEIYPITSEIKFITSRLRSWMKPRRVLPTLALAGTRSRLQFEPKGVVLIISPWNFPFMLAMSPLLAAVAAGNAVVIKPSEMTPAVSSVIKKIVANVFDANEVIVVEGDATTAGALLALPFNHIFFTGSPRVGRIVMAAASRHLSDVTLELGGKSPVIVLPDANLDDTADKLVFGKCMNAGQTCVAPDYLLVHESVKSALIEKVKSRFESRYGTAESTIQSPDFARIINDLHFKRITNLINQAIATGAKIVYGGETNSEHRYISPTLIDNVQPDMNIMNEEIFGPVLPIISFTDINQALSIINARPKPLALYIFSKNKKLINQILGATSAGGSCVNDLIIQFGHHNLPFGGVNNSGIGASHGWYGFKAFSHQRPVLINPIGWNPMKWMYPPYTPGVRKLINLAIRWF
jgi:aldehyde dehydrogenase (NAD+)